ncbi:MAG: tRNA (adenosine(37)-N6)-threonylcarbamoyltransferase complex dimerization subunit type 1 TsaB, partial [Paracoccaceae bacterium]
AAALLFADGTCLTRQEDMAKGQAERLFPLLEDLLIETGISWKDLSAIGVGTGPGNFTGVRISVAAARGLALSLGIPAIGVTRMEAVAHGLPRPVTVVEDARRGEVYVQRFNSTGPDPAFIASSDVLKIEGAVIGSGVRSDSHSTAVAPFALTEAIALIAATRLGTACPRPAPFYLRGADAAPPSDPPPVILDA